MTVVHGQTRHGGVEIAWTREGGGAAIPLVLVMGWTGVRDDWRDWPSRFATDRPVLSLDPRGMGESSLPEAPWTIADMADDVRAVVDDQGWDRVHLLGVSMGGMVAQTLALTAPNRIASLTLGCTTPGGRAFVPPADGMIASLAPTPGRSARESTAALLRAGLTEAWIAADPARFEAAVDRSLRSRRPWRGVLAQFGALQGFDVAERIQDWHGPTLIVHGEADAMIPVANADALADRLPQAELVRLPAIGHLFWWMAPNESAAAVQIFLQRVEAGPA